MIEKKLNGTLRLDIQKDVAEKLSKYFIANELMGPIKNDPTNRKG